MVKLIEVPTTPLDRMFRGRPRAYTPGPPPPTPPKLEPTEEEFPATDAAHAYKVKKKNAPVS